MAAPTPGPRHTGGIIPAEWPAQAADTIVDTIAKVRDKTTKPAIVAARGLVYGLIAGVLGITAAIMIYIVLVHMWDNWFPGEIWIFYTLWFVLLSTAGLVLLRRANAPAPAATDA